MHDAPVALLSGLELGSQLVSDFSAEAKLGAHEDWYHDVIVSRKLGLCILVTRILHEYLYHGRLRTSAWQKAARSQTGSVGHNSGLHNSCPGLLSRARLLELPLRCP